MSMTLKELEDIKTMNMRDLAELRQNQAQLMSTYSNTSNSFFHQTDWSKQRPYGSTTTGDNLLSGPSDWIQHEEPRYPGANPWYPGGYLPTPDYAPPYPNQNPWRPNGTDIIGPGSAPYQPFEPHVMTPEEQERFSQAIRRAMESELERQEQARQFEEQLQRQRDTAEVENLKKRLKELEDKIKAAEDKQKAVEKQIEETKERERRLDFNL